MSTYNLTLPSPLSLVSLVQYSRSYTSWKSNALAAAGDYDDDDGALTGQELKDVDKICDFIKLQTSKFVSLMECVSILYELSNTKQTTEEGIRRELFSLL